MDDAIFSSIRSDSLATLRPLIERVGILKTLAPLFQLTIVVDANIVLKDILWAVRKRVKVAAKSELVELLHSQTIIAIAPTFLLEEVQKKIPEIAAMHKISTVELEKHWESFRTFIKFIDTGGPDLSFIDPKDAPYIKLQRQTGHLIYSRDSHMTRMGGEVIQPAVMTTLRFYSRHVAVEYTLKVGGVGSLVVAFQTLRLAGRLAKTIFEGVKKIPSYVWPILVGIIVLALLHESTRDGLGRLISQLVGRQRTLGYKLLGHLSEMYVIHEKAKAEAQRQLFTATNNLPQIPTQ
ncbi:PIN domain-containing protein [Collimonas sp. OK412]|uniref:PIN domain-containing protein n=1 Tax=Collimonas sp. (strain OK412) TaxID=1801619 RepID=UPI0008E863AE|nr:PIN domain-containing protein [Collimonas sp. OK412]SFC30722.1 Predicted nucleic acid-binding protein, contains PIN domain [Collimonas sp. OK412]